MTNKNTPESTERVVQGPDRVYRWKYTLTREQALVHFTLMNKIGAIIATVISAIMILFFYFGLEDQITPGFLLLFILLIYGMILGMPALIGYFLQHPELVLSASEKENAIILKEGITTYTMYVPLEDAAFVKNYIRVRIGSEKYER